MLFQNVFPALPPMLPPCSVSLSHPALVLQVRMLEGVACLPGVDTLLLLLLADLGDARQVAAFAAVPSEVDIEAVQPRLQVRTVRVPGCLPGCGVLLLVLLMLLPTLRQAAAGGNQLFAYCQESGARSGAFFPAAQCALLLLPSMCCHC